MVEHAAQEVCILYTQGYTVSPLTVNLNVLSTCPATLDTLQVYVPPSDN